MLLEHLRLEFWRKREEQELRPCRKVAIRRNHGTVRTFAVAGPAARLQAPALSSVTVYQHPTHAFAALLCAVYFSVPQFLGGGEGPPSNSDMVSRLPERGVLEG